MCRNVAAFSVKGQISSLVLNFCKCTKHFRWQHVEFGSSEIGRWWRSHNRYLSPYPSILVARVKQFSSCSRQNYGKDIVCGRKYILMLTSKVPGEGFHDLEVADIQKVLVPHAAKLSDEDLLTADNDQWTRWRFWCFVDKPQLATSALKKGFQVTDDLIEHLFEEDHLKYRCLKFKHIVETVTVTSKKLCNDMQIQSTWRSPFLKKSLIWSIRSFDHTGN